MSSPPRPTQGAAWARGGLALLVAASALAVVWWRLPQGSPPLYDGVCVANPYAYLNPPPGAASEKPSSAKHTLPIQPGASVPQSLAATNEFPPQAQLSTDDGSVTPPPGATSITLSIEPVTPPATLPRDGQVDGNFYRFAAAADSGAPATLNPAKPVTITLRPTMISGQVETIERLDGTHWTPLQTSLGSCSIYLSANSSTLGTFVLVSTGTGTGTGSPTPVGTGTTAASFNAIGVLVAVVVVLAVFFILLRLSRTRGARGRRSDRPGPPPAGQP